MKENMSANTLNNIFKSKFVRSLFFRVVLVFLIVVVVIIAIVFFSFTSEINDNLILERQKQLDVIEETISKRMEEVSSIAYNISTDRTFYIESVTDEKYSSYEMTRILERYLVGNDFIDYLAYYRLAEPNTIYSSSGEMTCIDFWDTFIKFQNMDQEQYMNLVTGCTNTTVLPMMTGKNSKSYITYVCPLPQFSKNPKAFVLIYVAESEIQPILETQLTNCYGKVAVYDSNGNELYSVNNMTKEPDVQEYLQRDKATVTLNGKKYIMQKSVSESNGWTYVSLIRMNDIVAGVVTKQLVFIVVLLALMLLAVVIVLASIIIQYKPINQLALSMHENEKEGDSSPTKRELIDEESLLTGTFATLKDDSEQKQKYEAAYHEAEAANKAKSTFLSNMSHDIRTPMNAIVGMTEIALKHTEDADYVKDCLKNVQVASQYLLDIINNVLDMSRIESGKFQLSRDIIDFPKLVHGMITIVNHSLEVKSQKLTVDIENIMDEKVIGDNVRLTQVFMNIISNSIKFTPNGGYIRFYMSQLGSTEEGYGDYRFVFTDTGIGMSQEFTKKVFDTFTRAEGVDVSKIEGTGLGMAIAKSFVELMGGQITCESEMGKGTTFIVTMHMKLAENSRVNVDIEKYRGTHIFIYGENDKLCSHQARLFRTLGTDIKYSTNLRESLQLASGADIIILHQRNDDPSGIQTVAQFRNVLGNENHNYVLAAKDLFNVEKSEAVNAGISSFVQIPLFRSTAIGILNRTFDLQEIHESNQIVNLEGRRILLVEDNKMNRKIAIAMISETKAEVVEAINGKEAVEIFKQHEDGYFDIILMDVQMPIMNGYEATAAIRSIQRMDAYTIPIYALTANTFDEDVRQVKEAGMNGHLGKPYVSEELYAILENAILR